VTRLAFVALALVLAGCGGDERGAGTATLWVTRDRGHTVLYEGKVPAGLTAMQALDRKLDIETRYGGRFVQAIQGLRGDAGEQRDWFWYVNGLEGDRSAGEYRLHAGDVEWWDYRSWKRQMRVPVVVGAWPKPVEGNVMVAALGTGTLAAARALARSIGATTRGHNRVLVTRRRVLFHGTQSHGRVSFVISARDAQRLAAHPELAKMRYEGLR
jgi:hypothetical protein